MKHWAWLAMAGLPFAGAAVVSQESQEEAWTEVEVAESSRKAEAIKTIEDGLVCKPKLYKTEFFGKILVWAGADLENPTEKTLHYAYHVALYDKDKRLLGASNMKSFTKGVEPGAKTQLGSCLIYMPKERIGEVKYAQWRFYTGESEIGAK